MSVRMEGSMRENMCVCLDAMSVLRVCVCVKSSVCVSKRVRVRGSMR